MNRTLPVGVIVLALSLLAMPPQAHAERVTPPAVPDNIQVPPGNKPFLVGHAFGTQNYICLPSASGFSWILFGPQATLFDEHQRQLTTHFLSPNPAESGTHRATWQHSRDTSTVWARAIAVSSDGNFVAPGAIPWLLLQILGERTGPRGGDRLIVATYIHRLNTAGGIAPSTGCSQSANVGTTAFVPYAADYFFYKAAPSHAEDQ